MAALGVDDFVGRRLRGVLVIGAVAGVALGLGGVGLVRAGAQDPAELQGMRSALEPAVPLVSSDTEVRQNARAQILWSFALGKSALEGGFYALAEGYFRSMLDEAALDARARSKVRLELVSALIGQGRGEEAAEVLAAIDEAARDDAWWVRAAAVAFLEANEAGWARALEEIDGSGLAGPDEAMYFFLRAALEDRRGERSVADADYEQAFALSASRAQRAVFRLAQLQGRLVSGEATEALANTLREQMAANEGRSIGVQFALQYAVVLDGLGRKEEAIEVLLRQRDVLQPEDGDLKDQTLLLLGLVATVARAEGQSAFRELLVSGHDPELQRAALIRLAADVSAQGGGSAEAFAGLLDELLERDPPHPLMEELLFFRAQLALRERDFERAEASVDTLLTRFPGTGLRRHAVAVLAASSWQRQRFRNAAAHLTALREELPAGPERVWLSALIGESYFRAGMQFGTADDFRNAAEAYATAFAEVVELQTAGLAVTEVSSGTLFYQRVLSAIRGGDIDEAMAALDDEEALEFVDVESRWQAEWNLVRYLQLQERYEEAFARVADLGAGESIPAGLRLRFLWLAAQMSVETGRVSETADRVEAVLAFLETPEGREVDESLRREVASSASLLRAEALLSEGDTDAGVAAVERLREEFPGTRAALYSFIVQARHLAAENRLADAQQLLVTLADTNKGSEYAPLALYEAALQAERRGQDAFLSEAGQLLERLATEYPEERYAFPARLKQADIARRLNQFAVAEQIYRYLENAYPNHPGRSVVQLALADTLLAQADADPSKFEAAVTRLERLAVLPSAEADLRAEAGYKLARAWKVYGNVERATQLYWDLYQRFLGDGTRAGRSGTRWRYWVSRGLLELAELEAAAGRLDNARDLYEALLEHRLPGGQLARGRLAAMRDGR